MRYQVSMFGLESRVVFKEGENLSTLLDEALNVLLEDFRNEDDGASYKFDGWFTTLDGKIAHPPNYAEQPEDTLIIWRHSHVDEPLGVVKVVR